MNLPLLYWFWFVKHCQTSPNKNKSQNIWQVTSSLVCCIFGYAIQLTFQHRLPSKSLKIISQKWAQPSMKNAQVVQYFDTLIDFYGRTFYGWNIEEIGNCVRGRSQTTFTSFWLFWPPYLSTLGWHCWRNFFAGKSWFIYLWCFQYHLPTSSCQCSLWTSTNKQHLYIMHPNMYQVMGTGLEFLK